MPNCIFFPVPTFDFWVIFLVIWFFNTNSVWKVSKYGVFSGPYFPAFGLNTEIRSICRMRVNTDQKKLRILTLRIGTLSEMKMLRKIIDCKSLGISQEYVQDGVYFGKVTRLQCTDCNSIIKRLHHRFFRQDDINSLASFLCKLIINKTIIFPDTVLILIRALLLLTDHLRLSPRAKIKIWKKPLHLRCSSPVSVQHQKGAHISKADSMSVYLNWWLEYMFREKKYEIIFLTIF